MPIEIATLLQLLEIDDDVKTCGPHIWTELAKHVDAVLDCFHMTLKFFEVSRLVPNEMLGALKQKQKEHWAALFGSNFSRDYAAGVSRIAMRHREIKLSPFWHVAGYLHLKGAFARIIEQGITATDYKATLLARVGQVRFLRHYLDARLA